MNSLKIIFMILLINGISSAQMEQFVNLMSSGAGNVLPTTQSYGGVTSSMPVNGQLDLGSASYNGGFFENNKSSIISSFDQAINETEYILGTGDNLTVHLWGSVNRTIDAQIDIEGNLIVPALGVIYLRGMTLKNGKEQIIKNFKTIYKKADITVSLSEIHSFKVYLLGLVAKPGYYIVNGATRISDLIQGAGGYKNPNDYRLLRTVEVLNNDYGNRTADLASFYHGNQIDGNFYLREGDRVFVKKSNDYILIDGAVNYSGRYEYRDGDQLMSVIKNIAGGFSRGADTTSFTITRFVDNKDSLTEILVNNKNSSEFKLQADDRIFIKSISEYRVHRKVTIKGEVKFPGAYPIVKDQTKLLNIIKKAGGLTEDSFLNGSKIIRSKFAQYRDREFDRLKTQSLTNMSPIERSYLKTKLVEENGIVSMDFRKLVKQGGTPFDIILRDGDVITISRKSLSINVSGAVVTPGLVSYKEGKSVAYYVNQAGGFHKQAIKRELKIIKGGTDVWLSPRKVDQLEAGDVIWVPAKEYRNGLKITKEVLYIIGSVAATLLSGFAISNAFK